MRKHIGAMCLTIFLALGLVLIHQSGLSADGPVDINHASLEELTSLKYVGETIAKRIIAYREQINGFKSVGSLLDVKGFGPKTLEANKERLVLSPFKKKGG